MQKSKTINTFNEMSAGGIVIKKEKNQDRWLVIRSLNLKRKIVYKFPKGHLLKDEFLKKAAVIEVEEEGRVKVKILGKIGSRNYVTTDKGWGKKNIKRVTFFLMEYLGPSSLRHFDGEVILGREWLTFEETLEKLSYDEEKRLLRKAREKIDKL